MRNTRGFTLTRTLIALMITLSMLPLASSVFSYVGNLHFDYDKINDELAFIDLRRILLLSYDMEVNDYSLSFRYQNEIYYLNYVNNKLILQPGTVIYLNNIDEANFFIKGNSIYVSYTKCNGETYEKSICKNSGIYLNDFLDNNDKLSEHIDDDV